MPTTDAILFIGDATATTPDAAGTLFPSTALSSSSSSGQRDAEPVSLPPLEVVAQVAAAVASEVQAAAVAVAVG